MPTKAATSKLQSYYRLAKPGIVYGNALPAIACFLLASNGHVRIGTFLAMIIGLSLVIGSACVFNNYIDRDIDKQMARTKKRAIVTGQISGRQALIYASTLGLIGSLLLGFYTNLLTLLLALFLMFAYVVLYGIGKRKTVHGTLIGSISGAMPPVVGYVAVSNHVGLVPLLLFAVLVVWQMPHFYAIAIFRSDDYAAAKIPVLPLVAGVHKTKLQIIGYIIALTIVASLLTVFGYTGYIYLVTMTLGCLYWLARGLRGFKTENDSRWARQMFGTSLLILLLWSGLIALSPWLP